MTSVVMPRLGAFLWAAALGLPVLAQPVPAVPAAAAAAAAAETGPPLQRLTVRAFAALVAGADELVRVQRLEPAISDEAVRGAKAAFEPFLFASVEREGMRVLNSAIDAKQRGLNPGDVFDSQESRFKTGVGLKVLSGADVELSYNASQMRNSLQPLANAPSPENKGYLGFKVTQPLLRGAGLQVNQLGVQIAEAEQRVAGETVRQLLAQRVMEGLHQYLLVQRAEERVRLRTAVFEGAAQIEQETARQQAGGLRSAAELTEARSSLALRRAQLAQAQQDLAEQVNALQIFLSARERLAAAPLQRSLVLPELPLQDSAVQPPVDAADPSPMPTLDAVLQRRPEARISSLRVQREQRKVDAALDQARPDLSLSLRYGKESLGASWRFPQDHLTSGVPYNSWSIGVSFRIGLFGDEKKGSEYQTATYRRQQAELAAGAVQQRIANELHASTSVLEQARQQLLRQQEIVTAQRSLLGIEQALVQEGRRSSLDVARKRLETLLAEEALADAQAQLARATYFAAQTDGSLLPRLGLE